MFLENVVSGKYEKEGGKNIMAWISPDEKSFFRIKYKKIVDSSFKQ